MRIHAGFDISYDCLHDVPMLLLISVHPSRAHDLLSPGIITFTPGLPVHVYRDGFGNDCTRIWARPGRLTISTRFDITDSGLPDEVNVAAGQFAGSGFT